MRTYLDAKPMAKALRAALEMKQVTISHSESLEIVARQFGFENWNILAANIETSSSMPKDEVVLQPAVPVFRIFSVEKAREFYCDFLDFIVDWISEEQGPAYMQVSRASLKLHLTEHHGDAAPGSLAFIWVENIEAMHWNLTAKNYKYMRPGLEDAPWGRVLVVTDPFSNRLKFSERR